MALQKPLTIKQLKEVCEIEIKKGNGDKSIMISNDDEGNGYHYLWWGFSNAEDFVDIYEIDENIAKIKDTIVLG